MNYAQKLKDPRWQMKRLKVFERDGWKCVKCGESEKELQVHHLAYRRNPWESPFRDLKTLCRDCHRLTHFQPNPKTPQPFVSLEVGNQAFEAMRRALE